MVDRRLTAAARVIRPEAPGDIDAIRSLHLEAFPSAAEAGLVDQLRRGRDAKISLVAVDAGHVVGHVMFSAMRAPFTALGMGPVSVAADMRRQGIAARLIREGLALAASQGWEAVFVVGDPAYYGRFGFNSQAASGFASPYAGPYFMVLALGGELPVTAGRVDYAPAFAAFE